MEQNGPALLAILKDGGWSTALNENNWTCSFSSPQWTINANSWANGLFIPFNNYSYSITIA